MPNRMKKKSVNKGTARVASLAKQKIPAVRTRSNSQIPTVRARSNSKINKVRARSESKAAILVRSATR